MNTYPRSDINLFFSPRIHNKEVVKDLYEVTYKYINKDTKDNWNSIVRSVIASQTLYNKYSDFFIYMSILYEIPSYGGSINPIVEVRNFLPNIYEYSSIISLIDLIRLIICILILILEMVFLTNRYGENKSKKKIVTREKLINTRVILSFLIFIFLLVILLMRITTLSQDLNILTNFQKVEYEQLGKTFSLMNNRDCADIVQSFEINVMLECILIIFLIAYVIEFFNILYRYKIFVNYVANCFRQIFFYYLIVLLILFSFSLFANNLWGQFREKYSDIYLSITSTLLFSIGHLDFSALNDFKEWSMFYLCLFFFIFIYFIMTSFVGIFIEAYRLNSLKYGNMNDNRILKEE
jgi:hypothetical protein